MPGPLKRPQKGMFSAARKEPLSDSFTRIDRDHNNHDKDIEIRDDVTEDEDYIEEPSGSTQMELRALRTPSRRAKEQGEKAIPSGASVQSNFLRQLSDFDPEHFLNFIKPPNSNADTRNVQHPDLPEPPHKRRRASERPAEPHGPPTPVPSTSTSPRGTGPSFSTPQTLQRASQIHSLVSSMQEELDSAQRECADGKRGLQEQEERFTNLQAEMKERVKEIASQAKDLKSKNKEIDHLRNRLKATEDEKEKALADQVAEQERTHEKIEVIRQIREALKTDS